MPPSVTHVHPEPERITLGNWCDLAERWVVSEDTMYRVAEAANTYSMETGRPNRSPVKIVSGFRTVAQQNTLRMSGRPAAANDLSTHLSCPATGIDISLGFASRFEIVLWGQIAMRAGLRWGGGGPVNEVGIPVDWQHVDRGPRK